MYDLIDFSEIISKSSEYYPPGMGNKYLYFLIQDNKIVYVGQSYDPGARFVAHSKDKDFDRVVFYLQHLAPPFVDELEALHILTYAPIYNKTIPPNRRFVTIEKMQNYLKEHFEEDMVREILSKNVIRHYVFNGVGFYDIDDDKVGEAVDVQFPGYYEKKFEEYKSSLSEEEKAKYPELQ